MTALLSAETVIGILGGGALGTAFSTWIAQRGQHNLNLDERFAKLQDELTAKITRLENKVAQQQEEIFTLRGEVNAERAERLAFERRVWDMRRYRAPESEWSALDDELAQRHGAQRRRADPIGRILIADDDPDQRKLIERAFMLEGWSVEVAETGRIAISLYDAAIASKMPVGLMILDYEMSDKTGADVARVIRNERKDSRTPIVIYTGHGRDVGEALEGLGVHLWVKPVMPADMCERARELIGQ